jgi:hypothetical protein
MKCEGVVSYAPIPELLAGMGSSSHDGEASLRADLIAIHPRMQRTQNMHGLQTRGHDHA